MFIPDDPSSPDFNPFPSSGTVPRERVLERKSLLGKLDRWRTRFDDREALQSANIFHEKALSLITSPEAVRAFDLTRERPAMRERYGMTTF
jgi:hypothetical protein